MENVCDECKNETILTKCLYCNGRFCDNDIIDHQNYRTCTKCQLDRCLAMMRDDQYCWKCQCSGDLQQLKEAISVYPPGHEYNNIVEPVRQVIDIIEKKVT